MATTTATAVIGHAHPSGGGINPTHVLFLTENDRPSLSLYRIKSEGSFSRLAIWIPTVENMLEDLLLMVAALTGAHRPLAQAFKAEAGSGAARFDMTTISGERRHELYASCRELPLGRKIVLSVLEDSTLVQQAARLRSFQADCELCLSTRATTANGYTEEAHHA
ncbi:MAG: hypothetical protein K1X67_24445 [Fimbriimonadaceae bacterium]|nr:hypothetical protein [Fimbriimonadaceae bacterium]